MVGFPSIPAKLLLFGEFSVLFGSSALTLPLYDYSAKLILPSGNEEPDSFSNTQLQQFWKYLLTKNSDVYINLQKLGESTNKGLYLKSDIPQGYGLGSSASLCVAIYKLFKIQEIEKPEELRAMYSQMESFFHGKSSGIDPLAIHFEKPLIIRGNKIKFLNKNEIDFFRNYNIYLLDTGIARNSALMISHFKESMNDLSYANNFKLNYQPLLEQIIDDIVHNRPEIWDNLMDFSKMQLTYFRKMIPEPIFKLWTEGLNSKQFCFKILGAGGGGYFLVFSKGELGEKDLGVTLKKLRF